MLEVRDVIGKCQVIMKIKRGIVLNEDDHLTITFDFQRGAVDEITVDRTVRSKRKTWREVLFRNQVEGE